METTTTFGSFSLPGDPCLAPGCSQSDIDRYYGYGYEDYEREPEPEDLIICTECQYNQLDAIRLANRLDSRDVVCHCGLAHAAAAVKEAA